jgi:hypothetical protein
MIGTDKQEALWHGVWWQGLTLPDSASSPL